MSTRTILVTIVALATTVIPAVAQAATIRVTTEQGGLLGNREWVSGSARSYVNDSRTAMMLPRKTALGQLVAATSFAGTPLVVSEFAGLGPYVKSIGTIRVGARGAWMLWVNGRAASVGAGSLVLKRSDRALWVLDGNYARRGPSVLDLRHRVTASGTTVFTVRTSSGKGWKAAKGASVIADGVSLGVTDAKGVLSVDLDPGSDWDVAVATMKGAIDSQAVLAPMGS
jgi:hypothetical protein